MALSHSTVIQCSIEKKPFLYIETHQHRPVACHGVYPQHRKLSARQLASDSTTYISRAAIVLQVFSIVVFLLQNSLITYKPHVTVKRFHFTETVQKNHLTPLCHLTVKQQIVTRGLDAFVCQITLTI
jgi:hypothetical protein